MKIEKISDSQIRIILSREDLAGRELKLSELAYGTDKARKLFSDMMQQAAFQYGFETANMPLMIEAIPLAEGSIVLIVTKVDNPEELDTRFANFSPAIQETAAASSQAPLNPFEQLLGALRSGMTPGDIPAPAKPDNAGVPSGEVQRAPYDRLREYIMLHRLYVFTSMTDAITASKAAGTGYTGESTLYADKKTGRYYLSLCMKDLDEVSRMQRILAVLSEYGTAEPATFAREQHLSEHCKVLFSKDALSLLCKI